MESFVVRSPLTEKEWEAYYQLRFNVLRKAWGWPKGSEKDSIEDGSIHAAIFFNESLCLSCGRLQNLPDKPQWGMLRGMATHPEWQSKGLGSLVLSYIEEEAKAAGYTHITLNGRIDAVNFYVKNGYSVTSEGPLLWGIIPHKICTKSIK